MKIVTHEGPHQAPDWCHVCGQTMSPTADVFYPQSEMRNASDDHYVRICLHCARAIVNACDPSSTRERVVTEHESTVHDAIPKFINVISAAYPFLALPYRRLVEDAVKKLRTVQDESKGPLFARGRRR